MKRRVIKKDARKRTSFMVTNRKGTVILHSPRGSNIVIKPDELAGVLGLLTGEMK